MNNKEAATFWVGIIMIILITIILFISLVVIFDIPIYENFKNFIISFCNNPLKIALLLMIILIIFLIIMLYLTLFTSIDITKSIEGLTSQILFYLFFSFLFSTFIFFILRNNNDFKSFLQQTKNNIFLLFYIIFIILFYNLVPKKILENYPTIINISILILGFIVFAIALLSKSIVPTDINLLNDYIKNERIKYLSIFISFIILNIYFYINNPNNILNYLGYNIIFTILISIFLLFYLIILFILPQQTSIINLFTENWKNADNLIKIFTIFFLLFLITLSIVTILYYKELTNTTKLSAFLIYLLLIIFFSSIIIITQLFKKSNILSIDLNKLTNIKKSLLLLLTIIIIGYFIYWFYITSNIQNSIVNLLINLLIIILVLGLIYKLLIVKLPDSKTEKTKANFFNVITSIIFYIPCLFNNLFDNIAGILLGEYNKTEKGTFLILLLIILLYLFYFLTPSIFNIISNQGGKILINKPISLNSMRNLGTYKDFNSNNNFDYSYAISFWVYIDSLPPNTNENYNKFTSIFNYANKPNILYNPTTNELMISVEQKELKETKEKTNDDSLNFDDNGNRIIYREKNYKLQKWNNIIINYVNGIMDIFINGTLVKSAPNVVPYYTLDSITTGFDGGLSGGLCNLVYHKYSLTKNQIYTIYNTIKWKDPPILHQTNILYNIK